MHPACMRMYIQSCITNHSAQRCTPSTVDHRNVNTSPDHLTSYTEENGNARPSKDQQLDPFGLIQAPSYAIAYSRTSAHTHQPEHTRSYRSHIIHGTKRKLCTHTQKIQIFIPVQMLSNVGTRFSHIQISFVHVHVTPYVTFVLAVRCVCETNIDHNSPNLSPLNGAHLRPITDKRV